jgi:hypothetical protein
MNMGGPQSRLEPEAETRIPDIQPVVSHDNDSATLTQIEQYEATYRKSNPTHSRSMAIPYFFHFETIKALHRLTKAFDSLQGEN